MKFLVRKAMLSSVGGPMVIPQRAFCGSFFTLARAIASIFASSWQSSSVAGRMRNWSGDGVSVDILLCRMVFTMNCELNCDDKELRE